MLKALAVVFALIWDSLGFPILRPRPYSLRVVQGRDGFGNSLYAVQIYSLNFRAWKWLTDGQPRWIDFGDGALLFFSREDAQARLEAIRREFREVRDGAAAENCKVVWR